MYKLTGVTKNYQKGRDTVAALRGVDLVVEDGEWLAIQGPTGQGKSTLLQMLGGLDRPSAGVIDFDGRDLAQLRETEVTSVRAKFIGFVFQTFNLIPTLSAQENVETALDNVIAPVLPYRTRWDKRDRARELLDAVGLAGREQSLPARMSGGEQQRVAIARALVNHPSVLLADEPTGNLDTQNAAEIMALLTRLRATRGMTIVLASHDMQIAARSERLLRLRDGVLEQDIDLTEGYPVQDVIRRASQLG